MRKLIIILLLLMTWKLATGDPCYANNISITNVTTGAQDTVNNTLEIQFDLSWENAWKDAVNYDAAWIFIKYSTDSGSTWNHATLKTSGTNPTGFSDGTVTVGGVSKNLDIIVPTDKLGAFAQVSSAETASGTLSATDVTFVWDYGTDIGTDTASDNTAGHPIETVIRVMAIEMVYIPQGNFYAGDASSTDTIMDKDDNGSALISTTGNVIYSADTNYDDTQFGNSGAGILVDGDGGIDKDGTVAVDNANFPTGYNAFYIMKYELSHKQYMDFLNMLTRTQQNTRTQTNVSTDAITNIYVMSNTATISYRSNIICPASGNGTSAPITFSTTTENRACNYLSWMDLTAYADWAGLRPFTELEYEKAARGPSSAVAGEYAWGNTSIHGSAYTITNDGAANATVNQGTGTGNASYSTTDGSIDGPLRCGIFAQSTTSRQEAGASYYGVMELSGNLWERPVTVGVETGRSFDGAHGDGALAANGNANGTSLQYWPGYSSGEVTGATGSGLRGSDWGPGATYARVSDRNFAACVCTNRNITFGARCARTSP